MPKKAPAASIPNRLPELAEKTIAPLLDPEELALALSEELSLALGLSVGSAVWLLDPVKGKTLAIDGSTEPLAVVANVELLIVVFVVDTAREYEEAVQAGKDVELVQVVSSFTEPDGVAVPTVA